MAKINDQVIKIATKLIYEKGISSLTFSELARLSAVPETTLRRHFNGSKMAILLAVLELASKMIAAEFKANVAKAKLNLEVSDPERLTLLYVQMAIELAEKTAEGLGGINENNLKIWQTRILFSEREKIESTYTENEVKPEVNLGINILDNIILRGCDGNLSSALSTRCVIFGTLTEYIDAKSNQSSNQARNYEVASLLKKLDIFLTAAFVNPQIKPEKLENQGISVELLKRLRDAIDQTLDNPE